MPQLVHSRKPETASVALAERFRQVRGTTEQLCAGLATEDFVVQSMPDVSPTKWHLAHTSWFFETFVLKPFLPGYAELDPAYAFLFNSYYVNAGERHCRAQRGYLSRPTVAEVFRYRAHVDENMLALLERADEHDELRRVVEIGLHHEQQHQELLVTDIKHVFSVNPLRPAYAPHRPHGAREAPELEWHAFEEGLRWIGHDGNGYAFDNEGPRHREFVHAFRLASRPATNGEYLAFMDDGGYRHADLWLSAGWATVQEQGWSEPFYWERRDGQWQTFTLAGMRPVDLAEPVCHLSYFEADAFARWSGARLPTEAEWEVAASGAAVAGNLLEAGTFHPAPPPVPETAESARGAPLQLYGDVWEWTRSQYSPYPGFEAAPGALGEYNGKFMCNQFVLRGGSCATPESHIRATYRNFFPPDATWQFTGVRLAGDL